MRADETDRPRSARMARLTRMLLVLMAAGLIVVFALAAWIRPYDADGNPRSMATHQQLGLPPCSMTVLMGKPCPSCGMTTAFALLIHGDVTNSLRANWVGTLLAIFWMLLIPWAILSVIRGRLQGVRNGEITLTIVVGVFLVLMLGRWAVILLS
jgi:hypothetical protein